MSVKAATVHVPNNMNLEQCQKVLATVLGKCGHPLCYSGINIGFQSVVDPANILLAVQKGSLNVQAVGD